jgi:hypothetical protein
MLCQLLASPFEGATSVGENASHLTALDGVARRFILKEMGGGGDGLWRPTTVDDACLEIEGDKGGTVVNTHLTIKVSIERELTMQREIGSKGRFGHTLVSDIIHDNGIWDGFGGEQDFRENGENAGMSRVEEFGLRANEVKGRGRSEREMRADGVVKALESSEDVGGEGDRRGRAGYVGRHEGVS